MSKTKKILLYFLMLLFNEIKKIKSLLIVKSSHTYMRSILSDQAKRQELFNKNKTPKQSFSFLFFIILLGQVGILTSIVFSTISGNGFLDAVALQGNSGNFLTFEISLIFSCTALYFQEYGEDKPKILFSLRITYLILGLSIAFLAMLNYIYISTTANLVWTENFIAYNISLYILGIYISYKIHMTFIVAEETASEFKDRQTNETQERARDLTDTSSFNLVPIK